ncbi:MAG: DUF4982 domain-containing protein [Prevotellaceae bacterium]|nr:DUF4982 domain-containing protein [Candidatus Minthosoma caballi]
MKKLFLLLAFFVCAIISNAQSESRRLFTEGWKFQLGDVKGASAAKFNDGEWRTLNLPHDWAIEGDFSKDNPSGTGGGALPGGIGWYRKTFMLNKEEKGKRIRIDFDGVYMNATVYVNGKELGTRPYGYISFGYDITDYLDGDINTIAVRVDNQEQPNSRWYSGCGIYRNVWLTATSNVHVAKDGTYIISKRINDVRAAVHIEANIQNDGGSTKFLVSHEVKDPQGHVVANTPRLEMSAKAGETVLSTADLPVLNPQYWDTSSPALYTVQTKIFDKSLKVIERYDTRIGIRDFEFTDKGFKLNGKPMQIQGVCNHHDLGCLGAAVNTTALRRQLTILKEMGINGIRCSHNPPAPELLDLCDEYGFIVMDEAFDMWRKKKTPHDYARYFNEWHERDLHDFIVRDRNHPSIVMWSIGNEVLEQWSDASADTLSLEEANLILNFGHSADMLASEGEEMSVNSLLTKKLADFVRNLDSTRPVTAGCNEPNPNNHLFASGALDIIGFNYHNQNIPDVPKNFPGMPFIITESVSALQTRGYYRMPSSEMFVWPERWDKPFYDPSFSCSSYDNCHAPWSNTHEENLIVMKKYPWIAGQYIWTGFDYIGEPTPYGWPARSSYFGIIDLAGFPKDVYYLYQSELTDRDVLHLFPHWNWQPGQDIDMWAYYNNADEVELFVNGVSQGKRSKTEDKLHVVWNVKYQPGEVKIVAYKDGNAVREQSIKTAGAPAKIRLTADKASIKADGRDLAYITVEVVDKDGNLCPNAENLIKFELDVSTAIAGVDNGSPISLERFKDNKRKAFYGKCLVVLQNTGSDGTSKLTATSDGLESAEIVVESAR